MQPNRIQKLPEGAILIHADDAYSLAHFVFKAAEFAQQRGARMNARALALAVDIASVTGKTAETSHQLVEPIQYEHVDTETAAHILGCTPRNIRDLANRDRLPGHKIGGRWSFNREDVEVFKQWRNKASNQHERQA